MPAMIRYTLKQLAYFVAAAEQASVTGAARALNVSQPAISAAIAHLEGVFGVQLFLRHHAQGLTATPAGRRIFAEARNLLAQAQELEQDPGGIGDIAQGVLDVGCFLTFAPFYVPALLERFRARHPAVAVRLPEGDAETLQRRLALGTLDIALLYDLALTPVLHREVVAELPVHAVLPQGHRLARHKTVSVASLASEPFILLDLPHSRDYFRSVFLRFGFEPEVRYRTTSFEMVRGLVARGHGVALLNLRLVTQHAYDGTPLVCRELREPSPPLRIVLARLAEVRPTRAAEAFAACARDYFAEQHRGGRSAQRPR